MKSCSYVSPPISGIGICKIRKGGCTWPNLLKIRDQYKKNPSVFLPTFPVINSVELNFFIKISLFNPSSYGKYDPDG
jgi:hypothetical protein